jgi:hypothetical protein
MWVTKIIKPMTQSDYPSGYFPRKNHYKKDALELAKRVEKLGGKAEVVRG